MTPVALDAVTCWQLTQSLWHTCWVGLVVGVVAAVANRILLRAPAWQRYWLNVAALAVMGACLPISFAVVRAANDGRDSLAAVASVESAPPLGRASPQSRESIDERQLATSQEQKDSMIAALESRERGDAIEPAQLVPATDSAARSSRSGRLIQSAAPYITGTYLLGFYAMLLKLVVAIYGGKRLRAGCRPVADRKLLDILARQSERLALRLVPVVACCERVAVPVVVGVIRPMILLPASMLTGLAPDELGAVLMHELAHIRRYDHWLILVQRFLEAVLFFHPVAWYLSRQIHGERERCCDDLVVASGGDRLVYARTLLHVAELRLLGNHSVRGLPALAADGHRPSQLRQRVARLLGDAADPHVRFRNRWPALLLGIICSAALWIVTAGTWQLLAQPKTEKPSTVVAVVAWSAVVDEDVIDEIHKLNAAEHKQPADAGAKTIRCSAGALRKVIKSHLEQKSFIALGNRIEFIGPSNPSQRKTETGQSMADTSIIQNGQRSLLSAWNGGGQVSLEQQAHAARLKLKMHFGLSAASDSKDADVKFDENLVDGRVVGFVMATNGDADWKPSLIVVYEAVQLPADQLELFRPLYRTPDWVRLGPGGVKKRVARAVTWRAKVKRDVTALDPDWTGELPNGGHVQLVALSRPRKAPLVWWDPAGRPISGVKTWSSYRDEDLVALVRVWEVGASRTASQEGPNSVLESVDKETEKSGAQFVIVPAVMANADGRPSLTVGAGFGAWTASAQLQAADGANATLEKLTIHIQKLFKFDKNVNSTHTHLRFPALKDFDVRLDAVDRRGKEIAPLGNPLVQANSPLTGFAFQHAMWADDIDHFLIKFRPCHWAEFTNFAIEPAEPLEPPLDFSRDDDNDDQASNDKVQTDFIARFPKGIEVAVADRDNEKTNDKDIAAPGMTLPQIAERGVKHFEAIKTAHIKFRSSSFGRPFKAGITPQRCRELLEKYDLVERPDELRDLVNEMTDDERLRAGRPWSNGELHVAGRKVREAMQFSEKAPDIQITDGQTDIRWNEANSQVNIDPAGQSHRFRTGLRDFWHPSPDAQGVAADRLRVIRNGGRVTLLFKEDAQGHASEVVVDEATGFTLRTSSSHRDRGVVQQDYWLGWNNAAAGIPYPTVVVRFDYQAGQLTLASFRIVEEMRLNEPLLDTIFQLGAPAGSTVFDSRQAAVFSSVRLNYDVFDVTSAEQLQEANKPLDPEPKSPQERFAVAELKRLYALADDGVLKRIGPPYPASRKHLPKLLGERYMTARRDIRSDCIPWKDGKLGDSWPFAGASYSFQMLITHLLKLKPTEIEGDVALLKREIPGDFVHRDGAAVERLAESLAEIAGLEFQKPIRLVFREVERPVYLARGELKLALPEGQKAVALNGGAHSGDHGESIGFGNLPSLLTEVATYIRVPVIDETMPSSAQLSWSSRWYDLPTTKAEKRFKLDPQVVLRQITEQTGITFTEEKRTVRLLFVEEDVP